MSSASIMSEIRSCEATEKTLQAGKKKLLLLIDNQEDALSQFRTISATFEDELTDRTGKLSVGLSNILDSEGKGN